MIMHSFRYDFINESIGDSTIENGLFSLLDDPHKMPPLKSFETWELYAKKFGINPHHYIVLDTKSYNMHKIPKFMFFGSVYIVCRSLLALFSIHAMIIAIDLYEICISMETCNRCFRKQTPKNRIAGDEDVPEDLNYLLKKYIRPQ